MNFIEAAQRAKAENKWFRLVSWRDVCYAFSWKDERLVIPTNDGWEFIRLTLAEVSGAWEVVEPFECLDSGRAILMEDLDK